LAIRPGFASNLDNFLNRNEFKYGIKILDDLLSRTTGCKKPYVLYQESAMLVLELAGISKSDGYVVIKAISKKKISVIDTFKEKFLSGFARYLINNSDVEERESEFVAKRVWKIIEDSSAYSFNSSHSSSYAYDATYALDCKVDKRLTLHYFKEALKEYKGDKDKTKALMEELPYFNIKIENPVYGNCDIDYTCDPNTNILYRALDSINGIGEKTAISIIDLSNTEKFKTFTELLIRIKEDANVKLNKTQTRKLILIGFFRNFGGMIKLLTMLNAFFEDKEYKYGSSSKVEETRIKKLNGQTVKLLELENKTEDKDLDIINKMRYELEYLGVTDKVIETKTEQYIITGIEGKWMKNVKCYNLNTGEFEVLKYDKKLQSVKPLDLWQWVEVIQIEKKPKNIKLGVDSNGKNVWGKHKTETNDYLLKFNRTQL